MTIEQLPQIHQAKSFQPFRVHLVDGRHVDVLHTEFLTQSPTGRTMSIGNRMGHSKSWICCL
jgi:hypothetical protein